MEAKRWEGCNYCSSATGRKKRPVPAFAARGKVLPAIALAAYFT